jgi:Tfp pilus assembly protein PilX
MHTTPTSRPRLHRGSSLILAVLTILILTIIGVGVLYMMQIEDKLSGNVQSYKRSFYAAEAGLKVGEKKINAAYNASTVPNFLGTLIAGTPTYTPPGGSPLAYKLRLNGETYENVPVAPGDASQGTFTLYVRNDKEDPALVDTNATINLISVGIASGGIERVLEEQITIPNLTNNASPTQAGGGSGGTGSYALGN